MKHVMVATDFSERSDRALRRATLLARHIGARMTLITAVDEDRPRRLVEEETREAEALLRNMKMTLREVDNIHCETRVLIAEPSQAIVQFAAEMVPDLLVLGPHRRQLFRDIFVGTTAERTIRNATCPVLMVNAAPVAVYRNVLLTTDMSKASNDALDIYAKAALIGDVPHSVVHVFDAPMLQLATASSMTEHEKKLYIEDMRGKAAGALSSFMGTIGIGDIQPLLRRAATAVNHEILAAAGETAADLIVLASKDRRGLERLLLGSVTEKVLRDSTVDVLVIPSKHAA